MRQLPPGRLDYWLVFLLIWFIVVTIVFLLYGESQPQEKSLQEANKCPLCYGHTSCFMLHPSNKDVLQLSGGSKFPLLNYVNVKNVFFGWYQHQRYVLKKLAHNEEFSAFDKRVLSFSHGYERPVDAYRKFLRDQVFPDFSGDRSVSLATTRGLGDKLQRDHLTCASPRFLHFLYDAHRDASEQRFYHFATMLLINAEPLFLQAFPQSNGWPFPRYVGACGRLVIEQDVGPTLAHYRGAPWRRRVELALQLLEIAELLTGNDYDFNLYMTDVTADNFAVDEDGRLFLVDVEDLVVVDRQQVEKEALPGWNDTYSVPVLRPDGMAFEPHELCSHTVTDHNYFAICKGLLAPEAFARGMSGGLLHSPPEFVTSAQPELFDWLSLCANPGDRAGSRFEPAEKLRRSLNLVLSEEITD